MGDWRTSPVVWIGAITAFVIAGRVVFLIGQWKGKVDEAQSAFKRTLDAFMVEIRSELREIRSELRKVHDRIDEIFGRLPAVEIGGEGPLRLTGLGLRISERLGAGALADELVPSLRARVAGMSPCEVQELCFEYTAEEYQPAANLEDRIRTCAYENGVKRHQVLRVLAIELRDRLLAETGGIADAIRDARPGTRPCGRRKSHCFACATPGNLPGSGWNGRW